MLMNLLQLVNSFNLKCAILVTQKVMNNSKTLLSWSLIFKMVKLKETVMIWLS